jgi:effector-binding domain-containing protein
MTVVSRIELIEMPIQHVLSIRTTLRFADYPAVAQRCYGKIKEFAAHKQLLLSGCPFVCYHNVDLEHLDVEMGFPVARPVAGTGEIVGRSIPVQKAVTGIFQGPYQDSDPLMMEMMRWIADRGYEQQGAIFNYYLNDADRPSCELLTQIVIPVQ